MNYKKISATSFFKTLFPLSFVFFSLSTAAQNVVVAGKEYSRSGFHNWMWGKHYRKEWTTPASFPSFYLDTAAGGLTPYQAGGGRQSKSLRLHDKNGKEYVIRSINKSFGGALPEIYQHTFIESIVNDQVPLGHPYTAVTIPMMSEAAGVYHTNPRIVFIPQQPALDSFNSEYGNRLYLFEQRPDENWEEAANFGNSKNIIGTEKMLEKMYEDNDNRPDQLFFVRARLFDMLIGDGSRHEDQWRWASYKEDGKTIYKAIPRDRDQAFPKFDGWLLNMILRAAYIQHLQTFKATIPNVNTNNFPSRNLDRQIANEVTLEQWVSTAKELQQSITDDIIEKSVKELPPETYPISSNEIIKKLKSRREHLQEYASDYYHFLAKEVEVVGSKKEEEFHVTRMGDGKTQLAISKIKKGGEVANKPFYSRTFSNDETKEIRLYGLEGNDIYKLDGEASSGMKIRIIGGTDRDSIIDESKVGGGKKTIVYDDHDNSIVRSAETKLHLSEDTSIHKFIYENGFKYGHSRLKGAIFYSFEDKLYVGIAYNLLRQGWRKEPFKSKQNFQVNYSIMQKNFSFLYNGQFKQVFGKWNIDLNGNYDLMRWTNYYGLGNETTEVIDTRNYYQVRSQDLLASLILNRPFGKHVVFGIGPVYSMVKILSNTDRFINTNIPSNSKLYNQQSFGGGRAGIFISDLDDNIVPTKGIYFSAGAQYMQNLKESDRNFQRYDAGLQFYIPFFNHLVLAVRSAGATVTGDPEFYQHASIGGANTLRGYARDRFWGTTSFYSANELQYQWKVKSHLFNGKAGLIGFYDVGRVWQKSETSDTWHTGYGGGFMIAPFNKLMASFLYGASVEGPQIHIRLSTAL